MKTRIVVLAGLVLNLVLAPISPANGYGAEALPQTEPLYQESRAAPRSPDGWHFVPPQDASTLATGGPDDFGYTWDDGGPFSWIDATGGTNTLLASRGVIGPVSLGFTFSFYENNYTDAYIAASGALSFESLQSAYALNSYPVPIPSPGIPNAFIAPYWSTNLRFNAGGTNTGTVYYMRGGTAPNRYFVVEWYQGYDFYNGPYTFEVVLHENGNIDFSYQSMTQNGPVFCDPPTGTAIENAFGDDGLPYLQIGCRYVTNLAGKTVRMTRPTASARVHLNPKHQGSFSRPGEASIFQASVRNTGDFGTDTFDLYSTSTWPVLYYASDGVTQLVDTNANGMVDTGALAPASSITVTIKVETPLTASVGATNIFSQTARSALDPTKLKSVSLQTTMPAPFVQVYRDDAYDAMSMYLVRAQAVKKATPDNYSNCSNCDMGAAVVEAPGGNLLFVWSRHQSLGGNLSIANIEYALFDKYGSMIRPVGNLTQNNGAALSTYDNEPAIAALPNGRIGVTWYRYIYNASTSQANYNIFFAILDTGGSVVYGPANVTNNSAFGGWNALNVPVSYGARLAATGDNRFVLSWETQVYVPPSGGCTSNCNVWDIYYAILDSNGSVVKPITKLTSSTADGTDYYRPTLTSLAGNRALLAYLTSATPSVVYVVLDSAGNPIYPETGLGNNAFGLAAEQLSDGRIVLGWHHSASPYTGIQFAVLDSNYSLIAGPTILSNPAAPPNNGGWIGSSLSIAADLDGHAVLSWGDTGISHRPNLYYALVTGSGTILTPPMIFRTSRSTQPYISPGPQGQGNTTFSAVPSGADGLVSFSAPLFGGAPGSGSGVGIGYTNQGLATMTNVVLTATLGTASPDLGAQSVDQLTYLGDTSGVTPTVTGNTIVWQLPPLNFLDDRQFMLHLGVPISATIGTFFPVSLAMTSAQPDVNASNNGSAAQVMAAIQLFLPLIRR